MTNRPPSERPDPRTDWASCTLRHELTDEQQAEFQASALGRYFRERGENVRAYELRSALPMGPVLIRFELVPEGEVKS